MPEVLDEVLRNQLLDRREQLQLAVRRVNHPNNLHSLLDEVDAALARFDDGSFGICEHCQQPIEGDRLLANPLLRFCLCNLSDGERDALERDLELAAQLQRALLPSPNVVRQGWEIAYHYEPAGVVSGDYCDVIEGRDRALYFMLGDVSGKGVAAAMLTAQLHAMFRSLISVGLPLKRMLEQASRLFRTSALPTQYATLVCGRATADGKMEIVNAGHPPPFAIRDTVTPLDGADLPLGMFANEQFSSRELHFQPGHGLVIYSDGVSDALDGDGVEYGVHRIHALLESYRAACTPSILSACRDDLLAFCGSTRPLDDVTLFVIGRA